MSDRPSKDKKDTGAFEETEPGLGAAPDQPPQSMTKPADDSRTDDSGVRMALQEVRSGDGRGSLTGQVLNGLYELQELIGEGGMGSVYAARHVHLQKRFAVKLFRYAQDTSEATLDRFRQEAIAASRIDHPHIIDVVNFDVTENGTVFLVMELLEGSDLSGLLAEGPLTIDKALELIYQMGDALSAAHGHGIVHRDLKPENIFVANKGGKDFVKILDFGISKMRVEGEEQVRITRTGQVLGTPRYISPEQARGETEVDHRADVYALGAILYEMLCGQPPFEGRNYAQLLWQHANADPVALSRRVKTRLPSGVERSVMRALEKEPDKRFQTVAEMMGALRRAAGEVTPDALAAPGVAIRPLWGRGAALALTAVVVLSGAFWWMGRGDTENKVEVRGTETDQPAPVRPQAEEIAESKSEPPEPAAGETPAETKQAPENKAAEQEKKQQVTMRFISQPPGATVTVAGKKAGTTPLNAPVQVTGNKVRVAFSAPGHAGRVVSVMPAEGGEVEVRLRRVSPRPPVRPPLPIKRELR